MASPNFATPSSSDSVSSPAAAPFPAPPPAGTSTPRHHGHGPASAADNPRFRPRACARCSVSKLKCNWPSEPGETPCERCARSKTECVLPNLKPRGPRRGHPTRAGQLEQKLDGLMSLLTANQQMQHASPSPEEQTATSAPSILTLADAEPSPPSLNLKSYSDARRRYQTTARPFQTTLVLSRASPESPIPTADVASADAVQQPLQDPYRQPFQQLFQEKPPNGSHLPQQQRAKSPPQPSDIFRLPPLEQIEIMPGLKMSFHDANLALSEYRRTYSPHFPFVPIAPNVSALDLFSTHPLLFRTLMLVVVPQSRDMQTEAKRWTREQLALHIVVNEEKDVSFIQVILLYAAWLDLGFYIDARVTPLLQMAVGLVSDLGLHRPARSAVSVDLNSFVSDATIALRTMGFRFGGIRDGTQHSLQDMRAVLGCYYVCAQTSSLFRREPGFAWAPYMTRCCDVLLAAREFSSDSLAIALAKMQVYMARIYATLPNPEATDDGTVATATMTSNAATASANGTNQMPSPAATTSSASGTGPSTNAAETAPPFAPVSMAMASIHREVEALVNSQPPEVQSNGLLWTHYHCILLRLYEPAIYMKTATTATGTTPQPSFLAPDTSLRTDAIWRCLQAIRDFFTTYAATPAPILGVLPLLSTAHLSFSIVTLTRLFLLDDGAWRSAVARRSFDFLAVTSQLERLFQEADDQQRAIGESRTPNSIGRKMRYATIDKHTILATHRDKMRWIRTWYKARVMTADAAQEQQRQVPLQAQQSEQRPGEVPTMVSRSLPDQLRDPMAAQVPQIQQPIPQPISKQQQQQPPQQQHLMYAPAPDTGISNVNLMDVDMDGLLATNEFDSAFWKAIFDLDGSFVPTA